MALIGFCIWYLFYRIFIIRLGMIRPYFAQPSWCHWCEAALKISPNPNLICQIKIWSVSGEWNTIIKSTLFRSGQHSTILHLDCAKRLTAAALSTKSWLHIQTDLQRFFFNRSVQNFLKNRVKQSNALFFFQVLAGTIWTVNTISSQWCNCVTDRVPVPAMSSKEEWHEIKSLRRLRV